jgi:release factor glutamine methyltransferase
MMTTNETTGDRRPTTEAAVVHRPSSVVSALHAATQYLTQAGADSPRLTAEALLAHVLGLARAQLLARPEHPVRPEEQARFHSLVARAAQGEPLAYLTGRREFHGLDFMVDARVLVPRPETELLVDRALAYLQSQPETADRHVADVGTGSGCIAVTLAVKCPSARVTALDISEDALAVARLNAERHGVNGRVTFSESDLLASMRYLSSAFQVLCANLPYVPSDELDTLPVVRHEPRRALDGGPDGLLWVRRLLVDAPRAMKPGGLVLLEIGAGQGGTAAALAREAFPRARVEVHPDYAGLDRIVSVTLGR